MDTEEWIAANICGFDDARSNCFGWREAIRRAEVEVKLKKIENGVPPGKVEVTGLIKSKGMIVICMA